MSRSRRFEQRITIERAALEIVNTSSIAGAEQLAGLTAAAIENWSARVKDRCGEKRTARVSETLVALATETGLLADNSRAVFSPSGPHENRNVRALLDTLTIQCDAQATSLS